MTTVLFIYQPESAAIINLNESYSIPYWLGHPLTKFIIFFDYGLFFSMAVFYFYYIKSKREMNTG